MSARKVYIETFTHPSVAELIFCVRGLAEQHRQFSVSFDADGSAVVSTPDVSQRNPANPQPTPPQSSVLESKAA